MQSLLDFKTDSLKGNGVNTWLDQLSAGVVTDINNIPEVTRLSLRENELFIAVYAIDNTAGDALSFSYFNQRVETFWLYSPTTGVSYYLIPGDKSTLSSKVLVTGETNNKIVHFYFFQKEATKADFTEWHKAAPFLQKKSIPGGTGICVGADNPCTWTIPLFVFE